MIRVILSSFKITLFFFYLLFPTLIFAHAHLNSPNPPTPDDKKIISLWNLYKRSNQCYEIRSPFPGTPLKYKRHNDKFFYRDWKNPFIRPSSSNLCRNVYFNEKVPSIIKDVVLNEDYGERPRDVLEAGIWFRKKTLRYRGLRNIADANDIKNTLISWAIGNSFSNGINNTWGPVDYHVMVAVISITSAVGEVSDLLSKDERIIIGRWLDSLIHKIAISFWLEDEDNKSYMRSYLILLWGIIIQDDDLVASVIYEYKKAIAYMRPDGSMPIDTQRGGMGLSYNSATVSHLVAIALAIENNFNIDLFSHHVEGRSLHRAINFVVSSIQKPSFYNQFYATACLKAGDRWGSIRSPSTYFIHGEAKGYLIAYAVRFPSYKVSENIFKIYRFSQSDDSEKNGGYLPCYFSKADNYLDQLERSIDDSDYGKTLENYQLKNLDNSTLCLFSISESFDGFSKLDSKKKYIEIIEQRGLSFLDCDKILKSN